MRTRVIGGAKALVVSVIQPKARWWLSTVDVPCFGGGSRTIPDPCDIYADFLAASPAVRRAGFDRRARGNLPAFHYADGAPLKRDWLVKRTVALCAAAGIPLCDHAGKELPVKSASWRAGGARSAGNALLSDAMLMHLGRWTSGAWRSYMLHSPLDVQGATRRMWSSAAEEPEGAASQDGVVEDAPAQMPRPDTGRMSDADFRAHAANVAAAAVLNLLP